MDCPKEKMTENEDYIAMHNVAHHVEKHFADYYDRVLVNGVMIHSQAYHHKKKRNSSVVRLGTDNTFFSVKRLIMGDVRSGRS